LKNQYEELTSEVKNLKTEIFETEDYKNKVKELQDNQSKI